MIDDSTLWRHVYAEDSIKHAVMLNCLSPFKKQDMIHMAVITSMGEGKDHLIENVIHHELWLIHLVVVWLSAI